MFEFISLATLFAIGCGGFCFAVDALWRVRESRRIELAAAGSRSRSSGRGASVAPGLMRWLAQAMPCLTPAIRALAAPGSIRHNTLQLQLLRAGVRGADAVGMFCALRLFMAVAFSITVWAIAAGLAESASGLIVAAAVLWAGSMGFYLPGLALRQLIGRRQQELAAHFPDALDLIRLCVEAGLGLDAAIARVEKEIRLSCISLYDELHQLSLELRAGAGRQRALKNLALRTGLEEIEALVSVLIQVERFGTSVAESLRIHSEVLRTSRRQRAEEIAAKVPVKLLLPMIFCIFPALLVVLVGPAMIAVYRSFLPALGGG